MKKIPLFLVLLRPTGDTNYGLLQMHWTTQVPRIPPDTIQTDRLHDRRHADDQRQALTERLDPLQEQQPLLPRLHRSRTTLQRKQQWVFIHWLPLDSNIHFLYSWHEREVVALFVVGVVAIIHNHSLMEVTRIVTSQKGLRNILLNTKWTINANLIWLVEVGIWKFKFSS